MNEFSQASTDSIIKNTTFPYPVCNVSIVRAVR